MATETGDPTSIESEVLGSQKNTGVTLKSILNDPAYLKSILIFSFIINLLLVCGVIGLMGRGNTPIPTPTPTPTDTPTPTPIVTETPNEQLTRLEKCFNDCSTKDFLETLEGELLKVKHYKTVGDYTDIAENNCYGYFGTANTPDKTFLTYFRASECEDDADYSPPPTSYRLGTRAYFYNPVNTEIAWDTATIPATKQGRVVDIVNLMQEQQKIESSFEQRGKDKVRVLTAESEKVNEFNQVVQTIVQIKVNGKYEVVYFRNFEQRKFNENGRFWDYEVPNQISAPVD